MSKILDKQDQHGVLGNQESIFIFNDKIKDRDLELGQTRCSEKNKFTKLSTNQREFKS